jgi:hypothetical protein
MSDRVFKLVGLLTSWLDDLWCWQHDLKRGKAKWYYWHFFHTTFRTTIISRKNISLEIKLTVQDSKLLG